MLFTIRNIIYALSVNRYKGFNTIPNILNEHLINEYNVCFYKLKMLTKKNLFVYGFDSSGELYSKGYYVDNNIMDMYENTKLPMAFLELLYRENSNCFYNVSSDSNIIRIDSFKVDVITDELCIRYDSLRNVIYFVKNFDLDTLVVIDNDYLCLEILSGLDDLNSTYDIDKINILEEKDIIKRLSLC